MTDEPDYDIAANVVVQKWLSVHWKTMKIRDIEELIKTMEQPIENIGKLKNQPIKNEAHVNFDVSATH